MRMDSYSQSPWSSWDYSSPSGSFPSSYHSLSQYPSHLAESMEAAYRSQQQHYAQQQQTGRITESKPRLSKDEVDVLEAEFQRNHKPSTNVKKALAESMRVDDARINNWFQNRRAREKKERNIREYEARQKSENGNRSPTEPSESLRRKRDLVPSSAPFPGTRATSQDNSRRERSSSGLNTDTDSDAASNDAVNSSGASPNLEGMRLQCSGLASMRQQGRVDSQYLELANADAIPRMVSPNYDYPALSHAAEDDMDLASPDSMDGVATGRRPPPLAISGSRSFPSALPKTSADFNRRRTVDVGLRRISNGYPSRVQKLPHPPHSPFYDRRADTLYYLNRSPSSNGSASTMTPPTPETPMVVGQTSRDSSFLGKYAYADPSLNDPTLKTPPATPSIMDNMMDLNSIGRIVSPDDDLVNRYAGEFQHTSGPTSLPSYMSSTSMRSSQNEPSACQMGPNYFGYPSGNAEYNWSEASPSEHSSPGRVSQDANYIQSSTSQYPY